MSHFRAALKDGTYYCPATKHYGFIENEVICDLCHATQLKRCIGFGNIDLCMKCVYELDQDETVINVRPAQNGTKMRQRIFADDNSSEEDDEQTAQPRTRMRQQALTKMMQRPLKADASKSKSKVTSRAKRSR